MTPSPVPGAAVTQFAVIDALLAGAYESGLRVAEARSMGDGPPVAMDDDDILVRDRVPIS
jgi:hypothetical protein